jgi:hypothetical protein
MSEPVLAADALLNGVRRVTHGITTTHDPIEQRLMVEFCAGAPADMISLYLAIERRHAGLHHNGPAEDCDICAHQAGAFFNGALVEVRPLRLNGDSDAT